MRGRGSRLRRRDVLLCGVLLRPRPGHRDIDEGVADRSGRRPGPGGGGDAAPGMSTISGTAPDGNRGSFVRSAEQSHRSTSVPAAALGADKATGIRRLSGRRWIIANCGGDGCAADGRKFINCSRRRILLIARRELLAL